MTSAAPDIFDATQTASAAGRRPSLAWLLAAAVLAAMLAVPFFLVDVPPVLDYPNHLARYFVLAHPGDPILSKMYAPHWRVLPNLGMDVLGAGLLTFTSVHVGGRMLLALSLFAPVIGVVVYSRVAFGRFLIWPLASGVIAYNGIFHLGFMNFLLSLGTALVGAACWMALRRRGLIAPTAIAGGMSVCVIFFCHIFGVLLFAVLLGSIELDRLQTLRRSGRLNAAQLVQTGGLAVAVLVPLLGLYLACPLAKGAPPLGAWGGIHKLAELLTPFATYSTAVTVLTFSSLLIFVILVRRHFSLAPGTQIALIALIAIFVVAPTTIDRGTFVDSRIGLMMALMLFAGTAPQLTGRPAVIAATMLALVIGFRTAYVSYVWIDHRRDLADLRLAIAQVPAGARVLSARGRLGYLTEVSRPSRALPSLYRLDGHLPALLVIERRAFWPLLFADPSQQPLIVKPPYEAISQPLVEPVVWQLLRQDSFSADDLADARYLPNWRLKFDYVLLTDLPADATPPRGLTAAVTTGSAILYKITPP